MEYRTIQPTGVYARYSSSDWGYAERLWDGKVSTAPTKQGVWIYLNLDFSWLPTGAVIKEVTARYYYKRQSANSRLELSCTDRASYYDSSYITNIKKISTPAGTYNQAEYHTATVNLTTEESNLFLSKKHQLVYIGNHGTTVAYELYIDIGYELPGLPIYPGGNQSSEIYVGSTKVKAVYKGGTIIF